jgi:hypothetical protein
VGAKVPDSSASCQYNSLSLPAFPYFIHKLIIFSSLLLPPRDPALQIFVHREKEEMASRSPPPSKWGQNEDDNDESRHRKKLEKGKEPAPKDADEEPLFDDTKFAVDLLRSTFRKLESVGEAFNIKVHHDVYKDPGVKGLALRIHGLAEKLENLLVVKRAARRHFVFDDGSSDGDDAATTAGLRLIARLLYQS